MHHMARGFYLDPGVVRNGIDSFLQVRSVLLAAFFPPHQQNRTFNAVKKRQSVTQIKRLGRRSAVQRVKLPNPVAMFRLLHPEARQVKREVGCKARVLSLQPARGIFQCWIFGPFAALGSPHLGDPLFHSLWGIGKRQGHRPKTFDQNKLIHLFGKRAGVLKRNASPHRMPHQYYIADVQGFNQRVQVKYIVCKMIVTAWTYPAAVTMTAAIKSDDPERRSGCLLQVSYKRVPAPGMVEETVDQD